MRYDFIAVGDLTIDAFIQLKDAEVHCNINHTDCELCVKFGQKIPYEKVTEVLSAGNAANATVSARKIGLSCALVSWLGDDSNGLRTLEYMKSHDMPTEYINTISNKHTNYHYILSYNSERTILTKHEDYPYALPCNLEAPKYLYFSSISKYAKEFHHEVADFCAKHTETKLVFQPGTFQIKLGTDELKDIYALTEIFFCNKEEAQIILNTNETNIKILLAGIHALGPKIVAITDGIRGSYILEQQGIWHVPMYPDSKPPISRTGAGDATASTTVAYICKGMSPEDALLRGSINASSVVQGIGAQTNLLTETQIQTLLDTAPANFMATRV